jgi:hypothetical protein
MARNQALTAARSLLLLTAILLVSGGAWAQAIKTPVTGTAGIAFTVIDPGEIWDDEDGVRHFRHRRTRQRHRGDIDGRRFNVAALNIDIANGVADFHGSFTFTGLVLGDAVGAIGRFAVICIEWMCDESSIWFLSDGRKINMTERYPLGVVEPIPYEGVLLDAPGRR